MGMILTILTDIIHFGIYYHAGDYKSIEDLFRFSAGMAIFSLLLKPASCFFVYQMYRERGGEYNVNFGKSYKFNHTVFVLTTVLSCVFEHHYKWDSYNRKQMTGKN